MTDSCSDRYGKILEDFLGEENLKQCRKLGLTDNQLMHLYHNEFDRDQESFREQVESMLEKPEVKEIDRDIKDQIRVHLDSIEKLQQVRKGVVRDLIKEN